MHLTNAVLEDFELLLYVQFCILLSPASAFANLYFPLKLGVPYILDVQQSKMKFCKTLANLYLN